MALPKALAFLCMVLPLAQTLDANSILSNTDVSSSETSGTAGRFSATLTAAADAEANRGHAASEVTSGVEELPFRPPARGDQPMTDYYGMMSGAAGSRAPYSFYGGGGTNSAVNTIFVGPSNPYPFQVRERLGFQVLKSSFSQCSSSVHYDPQSNDRTWCSLTVQQSKVFACSWRCVQQFFISQACASYVHVLVFALFSPH